MLHYNYLLGKNMGEDDISQVFLYLEDRGYIFYDLKLINGDQSHSLNVNGTHFKRIVSRPLVLKFSNLGKDPSAENIKSDMMDFYKDNRDLEHKIITQVKENHWKLLLSQLNC